jgi:hypothetical protein
VQYGGRHSRVSGLSDRVTACVCIAGCRGERFDRVAGPAQQFTLGGPLHLSAFGRGELRGDLFAHAGVGDLYRFDQRQFLFVRKVYVGGEYEGANAFFQRDGALRLRWRWGLYAGDAARSSRPQRGSERGRQEEDVLFLRQAFLTADVYDIAK